jgi:site-specific DNA-methyltransferase (adenine-specific)
MWAEIQDNKFEALRGDCLEVMRSMGDESVDLIYLDPPFFTQKIQRLKTRDRKTEFSFNDIWDTHHEYVQFIHDRVLEMHRLLSNTGTLFFHCDRNASHIARIVLDDIFGQDNFQSEIIWYYKRWSNSKKGLLPSHQNIFFYSKSDDFTFNRIYQDYSESTNIDQILQMRKRDPHGKSVYATDQDGNIIPSGPKKGVPLSDVWEIPYLNPKAKERTGYPTQKPVLLLEQILKLCTNEKDLVLDPFCGSGTTLVTAKLLNRNAIGIDISEEAIDLTKSRLRELIKTKSSLLERGRETYLNADENALGLLFGLEYIPVQRNNGIDALLKHDYGTGYPVPIRVQKRGESLQDAVGRLFAVGKKKLAKLMILIRTNHIQQVGLSYNIPREILTIDAPSLQIEEQLSSDIIKTHKESSILLA